MNIKTLLLVSRPLVVGCCASALWGCGAKDSDGDRTVAGAPLGAGAPVFGDDAEEGSATIVGLDGQACAGQTAGTEVAESVLQLLVDTSGSMNQDAPGRGSKWVQTRGAVLNAIDEMPGDTSVGVVFYPNVPGNTAMPCFDRQTAVGFARLDAAGQRQQIRQAFGSQDPDGGTPTHDAYAYAVDQLANSSAIGTRFLVLITDGTPTYAVGCDISGRQGNDNAVDAGPLVEEAARARARGIRTFVIGSPGSEGARQSLSRMAEAGGTAQGACSHTGPNYCHFDMTQANDLASGLDNALTAITGLALSCSYPIPDAPLGTVLDPTKVNLLFTSTGGQTELIGQSPNGNCTEGWQYSDDQTQILLCGSTCETIRASEGTLDLQFGCSTIVR